MWNVLVQVKEGGGTAGQVAMGGSGAVGAGFEGDEVAPADEFRARLDHALQTLEVGGWVRT